MSASAGSYIYVASETEGFTAFFGVAPDYDSNSMQVNGDDAIELFSSGTVVDTFGDIDTDGSGTVWEYTDGWVYRNSGETANSGNFNTENWQFSGIDALDGSDSNATATSPFPLATFNTEGGGEVEPPVEVPTIELGMCGDTTTLISTIQGSDDASLEVGNSHTIEGVITGYRSDGFFIQEETVDEDGDDATSEGIFVSGSSDVAVGNVLRLHGEVSENYGMTTLSMNQNATALDCGAGEDVTQIALELPLTLSLESIEGMVTSVTDATVTSTNNLWRYGEVVISDAVKRQPSDVAAPLTDAYNAAVTESEANLITIEDSTSSTYPDTLSFFPTFSYANAIRIGDTVSASGPLNYSFGTYRINPTTEMTVTSGREATPSVHQGNLTVATFNVLNYFNGMLDGDGNVTFDYSSNRGAENETEFALQQARIASAIVAMNADVIGLMEIENDGFGENSAIKALVDVVNADLADTEQYYYIASPDSSQIGSDAITVGLIYRASVVTPLDDAIVVPMPVQQIDDDRVAQMRPSVIQSFTHNLSGETFAVAVNHFKSKGGSCAEDNADTSDSDEIQGSCNALRVSAAITLGDALTDETLPARKLILGDLNAYSAEDPVAVLTDYTAENRGYTIKTAVNTGMDDGAAVDVTSNYGYVNLAKQFDPEGFSYWFYGTEQVGSLDHVLANSAMTADAVDGTHWNINSAEIYQLQYDQALTRYTDEDGYAFTDVGPYRSSDHDPFIATFNLFAPTGEGSNDAVSTGQSGGALGGLLALLSAAVLWRRKQR